MKKELTITGSWDRRAVDPKKNFGIHGCEMRFLLGDDCGYVQFILYTNWFTPALESEFLKSKDKSIWAQEAYPFTMWQEPQPADLGYHSPTPQYAGQRPRDCHLLPQRKCYYDGSGLNAVRVFDVLRTDGSDGVWKELEKYWNELFSDQNRPLP